MARPCDYDGRGYDPPYDSGRDKEDAAIAYKIGEHVVELEQQLAACRALLREIVTHEDTDINDELFDRAERAAGGGE